MSSEPDLNSLVLMMNVVETVRSFKDANDDWRVDVVLAGLAIVFGLVPYVILDHLFDHAQTNLTAATVTSLIAFLAISVRRSFPLVFMWIAAAALLVQVALVPTPAVGILVVPLAAYTVARWVPGLTARLVVILGASGAVVGPLRWIVLPMGFGQPAASLAAILASGVCVGVVVTRTRWADGPATWPMPARRCATRRRSTSGPCCRSVNTRPAPSRHARATRSPASSMTSSPLS